MSDTPTIRPLRDEAELRELVAAAKADQNHEPKLPTHVFRKTGEIVGYASLNLLMPLLPQPHPSAVQAICWFHTEKLTPRECFALIDSLENIVQSMTLAKVGLVLVSASSPFAKSDKERPTVMQQVGYTPFMDTRVWAKRFTE